MLFFWGQKFFSIIVSVVLQGLRAPQAWVQSDEQTHVDHELYAFFTSTARHAVGAWCLVQLAVSFE